MQFLTSLFGGTENTALTAILALGIVLVLIVLGVWTLKIFFKASNNIGRGRNRRLSVIDSVAIDPKRQLLIIRRDNVEHLILTGGPQDVVVETGIAVEAAPRGMRAPVPGGSGVTAAPPRSMAKAPADAGADPEKAAIRSRIERFRELGRPAGARKPVSLRHTGLMRSGGREPAVIPMLPDKTEQPHIDSATSSPANDINGQAKRGAGSYYGDAIKAEGNQN
jgi:hypothetical protein